MHTDTLELKAFVVDQPAASDGSAGEQPSASPVTARVKVLNPLSSTGPAMHAELLSFSDTDLRVRVPRCILVGSMVRVRTGEKVAFGEVRTSVPIGTEFEIGLEVQRLS
jgi:hypothetical protein